MNRLRVVVRSLVVASLNIGLTAIATSAQAQTPGQVPMFAQPGTGTCNTGQSNDCVDSVITQDGSGHIGIGTTTPAAALDVATGDLNLAGNLFKGGMLFLHNSGGLTNTFLGLSAGNLTMTGFQNTATGFSALFSNSTGGLNTASGAFALQSNTTGSTNTASGAGALGTNTTGSGNTATGASALLDNTAGNNNTATGAGALVANCSSTTPCSGFQGSFNTASGSGALQNNTMGNDNTASGSAALQVNTTGIGNTALGAFADVSSGNLTNATAIGFQAIVNDNNKIRLGNTAVTVIEGQVPFTFTSDKNQKENFQVVDGADVLRRLAGLRVTSWNYIGHNPQQFRHYGPVAQEFFAAFGHDAVGTIGTPTTINSGDEDGILLIAVQALLKQQADLQKQNADLTARIDALERQLTGKTAAGR